MQGLFWGLVRQHRSQWAQMNRQIDESASSLLLFFFFSNIFFDGALYQTVQKPQNSSTAAKQGQIKRIVSDTQVARLHCQTCLKSPRRPVTKNEKDWERKKMQFKLTVNTMVNLLFREAFIILNWRVLFKICIPTPFGHVCLTGRSMRRRTWVLMPGPDGSRLEQNAQARLKVSLCKHAGLLV